jgi:hypothetical protein
VPIRIGRGGERDVLAEDFRGLVEPAGVVAFEGKESPAVAEAKRLGVVGRFESWRCADDLATGVREWLADDWLGTRGEGAARGASWEDWAAGEARAPLLLRKPFSAGERHADLGFRVMLVDGRHAAPQPLRDLALAGEWQALRETARERRTAAPNLAERRAAGSLLNVTSGQPATKRHGAARYAMVALPLTVPEAVDFCRRLGGELAVPRQEEEAEWLRRAFCAPDDASPIWFGHDPSGGAKLALPWPAEEVLTAAGERHAFVVRWFDGDSAGKVAVGAEAAPL